MTEIRVAEVMAALSLTTDLATGVPFEKGLRVCLIADELARSLALDDAARSTVFQTTLLRSIGCTSHAPENAAEFVDDTAFLHALKQLDPGDPTVLGAQLTRFGEWSDRPGALAARFAEIAPTVGPHAATTFCEVSHALAPGLGACPDAVAALDDVYERWDGLGIPRGRRAEELSLAGRIMHVAEQAVFAQLTGGSAAATAEVRRRAGGHLDPDLTASFDEHADRILSAGDAPDTLEAVLAAEPEPRLTVADEALVDLCAVLGQVADLKSTYLIGHSAHLAGIVGGAGEQAGLAPSAIDRLRVAAHLHNLGCTVVPSSILDRSTSGPNVLGSADRERLRLQGYWTGRILDRCPSLRSVAPLCAPAAALHCAFAEADWVTWARPPEQPAGQALPSPARLLEAAEAWATLTEDRPGRAALTPDAAKKVVETAAADGRLDPEAVAAVVAARGFRRPAPTRSAGLTGREIDVLRLAARGWSNKEIAAELVISERTVGHHLAHIYDKTGRRTRAGVAVWATQRGLVPAPARE